MGKKNGDLIRTFISVLSCPRFLPFHDPDAPQPWSPGRQDVPRSGLSYI